MLYSQFKNELELYTDTNLEFGKKKKENCPSWNMNILILTGGEKRTSPENS